MARIVWVLGAGFSRPLGGPLLNELLTEVGKQRVAATFPSSHFPLLFGEHADAIRQVYATNGPYGSGVVRYGKHWDNAEEYLEFLDAAAYAEQAQIPDAASVRLRDALFGRRPQSSSEIAQRLMAAECCAFYANADVTTEKWQPYRTWIRQLGDGDAVITFNYDLVVETAATAPEVVPSLRPEVIIPGRAPTPGKVPLIKLHGSVDWCINGGTRPRSGRLEGGGVLASGNPVFALNGTEGEIVIASPGPTKQNTVRERLEPLWAQAQGLLREASAIVFMGYRFPPSDSNARSRLMAAIESNNAGSHLPVHIVLGPNTQHPDVLRLSGMLEHVLARRANRTHKIRVHPMGAEDFMALCVTGNLLG